MSDITYTGEANVTVGLHFSGARVAKQNEGITPIFFMEPVQNGAKSEEEGRPIFDEMECVRIFVAGDQLNQVTKPVDDDVRERFADEYRRWKEKGHDQNVSGTPLRSCTLLTPLQVKEFEAMKIFNVEGLASIADGNLSRSPGLREYREKARAWLEQSKDAGAAAKYAAENLQLKDDIAALREEVARLSKLVEDDHRKSKRAA